MLSIEKATKRMSVNLDETDQIRNSVLRETEKQVPVHYSINSIDDFINKVKFIELNNKLLAKSDSTFGEYKTLFNDFYEEIWAILEEKLTEKSEDGIDDFTKRISNYVMLKLHYTLLNACKKCLADED